MSVVVWTDLSGQEVPRHIGMVSIVTLGNLDNVLVSTMVQNGRYEGSILGTIFPIFITLHNNILFDSSRHPKTYTWEVATAFYTRTDGN